MTPTPKNNKKGKPKNPKKEECLRCTVCNDSTCYAKDMHDKLPHTCHATPQEECKIRKQHCWDKGTGHNCALCCFCGQSQNHPEIKFPAPQEEEWVKEFYKEFVKSGVNPKEEFMVLHTADIPILLAFIKKIRDEAYKEGQEDEAIAHQKEDIKIRQDTINSIKEKLEKLKSTRGESTKVGIEEALTLLDTEI